MRKFPRVLNKCINNCYLLQQQKWILLRRVFFTFLPHLIFVSFSQSFSPQFLGLLLVFLFHFGPQPYLEPSPLDQIRIISLRAIPLHHRNQLKVTYQLLYFIPIFYGNYHVGISSVSIYHQYQYPSSLTRERYFQHSKIKFVFPRGHEISSIY